MSLWRFIGMISCATLIFGTSCAKSRIADVIALRLPAGYGVNPEGSEPLVSVSSAWTVADAQLVKRGGEAPRIGIRWGRTEKPEIFKPLWPHILNVQYDATQGHSEGPISKVEVRGAVAGTTSDFFNVWVQEDGAGPMATGLEAEMWHRNGVVTHNQLPVCPAGTNVDRLIEDVDVDGRVAITYVALGYDAMGFDIVLPPDKKGVPARGASYAFVINKGRCISFGRAIITRLRGDWAAGYRKYLNNRIALYFFEGDVVAVRWEKGKLHELGPGVILSINHHGLAIGATRLGGGDQDFENGKMVFVPGTGTDIDGHGNTLNPHAVLWDVSGRRLQLERDALRSVAYDVSDDGTVVGSLQAQDGVYHAFRWKDGRLERLDDLPHPNGWQFEAAYAIEKDGTIVGSGRQNGVPVVFKFRY